MDTHGLWSVLYNPDLAIIIKELLKLHAHIIPDSLDSQIKQLISKHAHRLKLNYYDDERLLLEGMSEKVSIFEDEYNSEKTINLFSGLTLELYTVRGSSIFILHNNCEIITKPEPTEQQILVNYALYLSDENGELAEPGALQETGWIPIQTDDQLDCEHKIGIFKQFISDKTKIILNIIENNDMVNPEKFLYFNGLLS